MGRELWHGYRTVHLAGEDPAHSQAEDCSGDRAVRRFSGHRGMSRYRPVVSSGHSRMTALRQASRVWRAVAGSLAADAPRGPSGYDRSL